jgi:hypothetical protein
METQVVELVCSQCGRSLPSELEAVSGWRHGELVLADDLDEMTAALLLCPDCVAEEHAGAYEEGGGA